MPVRSTALVCVIVGTLSVSAPVTFAQTGSTAVSSAADATVLELPDGAAVRLQLTEPLASNVAKLNDTVRLQAVADVLFEGQVVIARGALASGRVTQVTRQLLTRAGRIEVSAESVQALDGTEVKLRGSISANGGRGLIRGDEAELTPSADLRSQVVGPVRIAVTSAAGGTAHASVAASIAAGHRISATANQTGALGATEQASLATVKSPVAASGHDMAPVRVDDGRAAVFQTRLAAPEATARVKAWFDGKNVDYSVNPDTGRITSDWFGQRRCGPGFQHCANKAAVRIVGENGQTTVSVQVFERKREGGLSPKPWDENSTTKGKQTTEVAMDLYAALSR
jgi:hypothetical protein